MDLLDLKFQDFLKWVQRTSTHKAIRRVMCDKLIISTRECLFNILVEYRNTYLFFGYIQLLNPSGFSGQCLFHVKLKMKAILFGAYALLLCLALVSFVSVNSKRHKYDFDALEKEWEKGDSEEELEHEYNRRQRVSEKLIKNAGSNGIPEMPYMSFDDPDEVMKQLNKQQALEEKAMKKSGGARHLNPKHAQGGMMFVELDIPGNKHLKDKKSREKLASRWRDMMHNAALDAQIYIIADDKFLMKVDKGWLVQDVLQFAAVQPEVRLVTLDNKNYYGKDFGDEL